MLPLRDDADDIYAGMIVTRDVTEARKYTQALQQYTEDLARSNSALEEFAYVASHDLQEPLRKIQAFGSRLEQRMLDGEHDEQVLDYLQRMMNASTRMRGLIQDLLTFSRITTDAQPFQAVDLNEIVADVLSDLEIMIEQKGAEITIASLPIIEAASLQMRQLFQNLLSNALKYQQPDTPPVIRIFNDVFEIDGRSYVRFEVSDNGIGFDAKHAERIFGVFQRLHNRSNYEGTGIGLAICRKIVERHHGQMTATGQEGWGASFTVVLPMSQT